MENPVVIRSHGGRARSITAGDIHIDVAFLGLQVPTEVHGKHQRYKRKSNLRFFEIRNDRR